MTCRDLDELLLSTSPQLPDEAQEHLRTCDSCRALVYSINAPPDVPPVDRSVLDRVRGPLLSSLTRVRPLAPPGVFMSLFLLIVAAATAIGAKLFGLYGLHALTPMGRVAIFAMLVALAMLATWAAARDMHPGARTMRGSLLFVCAIAVIETVFLALFHDYSVGKFVHWGTGCLRMGLECAIPTAILIWVLVRRGYVVAPVSTGSAIGLVGGLAGLTVLELHCPILTIPHVAIWHAAVVMVSVGAGAGVGWLAQWMRNRWPAEA